jgi:hypothetical protein
MPDVAIIALSWTESTCVLYCTFAMDSNVVAQFREMFYVILCTIPCPSYRMKGMITCCRPLMQFDVVVSPLCDVTANSVLTDAAETRNSSQSNLSWVSYDTSVPLWLIANHVLRYLFCCWCRSTSCGGEVVFKPAGQPERQGLPRISARGHVSISRRIIKVLVGRNVVCSVLVSVALTLF